MMGLTIEVAPIVRKPPGPPVFPGTRLEASWYEQRWGLVRRLCDLFGWRRPPWTEPGEREESTWTSFGRGRYYHLLWAAALVAEHGPSASREMIPDPYRDPPPTAHFPYLTSRQDSGLLALYLPVALAEPVVLDAGTGFHPWDRITIGSAVRLGEELVQLTPDLNDSWAGVVDVAATIGAYCAESQALNLPLWMEW